MSNIYLGDSKLGTRVKGSAESTYREGDVNITPANLGITVVNNTADSNKSVKYATSAGSATKATQDGSGNNIVNTYATKSQLSSYATTSQLSNYVSNSALSSTLSSYATKSYVDSKASGPVVLYSGSLSWTFTGSRDDATSNWVAPSAYSYKNTHYFLIFAGSATSGFYSFTRMIDFQNKDKVNIAKTYSGSEYVEISNSGFRFYELGTYSSDELGTFDNCIILVVPKT